MEKNLLLTSILCITFGIIIIVIITIESSPIKIDEPLNYSLYFFPNNLDILNLINNSNKVHCAFYDLDFEIKGDILTHHRKYGLMHNKFCILDDKTILTGSTNPTERGFTKNNNHLILINSKELVENYEQEFQELKKGIFGEGKQTKNTKIIFKDAIIENYFCPEDNCAQKIIDKINKAEKSIYFMTFSFTHQGIAQAIVNKKNLNIKGIIEKTQQVKGNKFNFLKQNNISVIYDSNPYKMHHKVFIIDDKITILGSMNPTLAGDEVNDENILIIENEEIANKFTQEFILLNTI